MKSPTIITSFLITCLSYNSLIAEPTSFSSIDRLPDGTSLSKVSIPEYNEKLEATGIFKADKIIKHSSEHLSVENLHIEKFKENDSGDFLASLDSANFYPESNLVVSNEELTLIYQGITTEASGILFKLSPDTAYLVGPCTSFAHSTLLNEKTTPQSTVENSIPEVKSPVENTQDFTGVPAPLTPEKIQQLNSYLDLKSEQTLNLITQPFTQETATLDSQKHVQAFLDLYGSKLKQTKKKSISTSSSTNEASKIKISCDGGVFYDASKGLLSYIKNVKVDEARLKVRCSKDLQVFLPVGEEKEKINNNKGIKKIIAVGEVTVEATKQGKNGLQKLKGKAQIVEFDFITGVTIFKGGFPSFTLEDNGQVFNQTAKNKDQWFIIQKDGSFSTKGGVNQDATIPK